MNPQEVLKFCIEKGLLLDEGMLQLLKETSDTESAKLIIEKIKNSTSQKIITKEVFLKHRKEVKEFFSSLPEEKQNKLEKLKIKLGLRIEISKEITTSDKISEPIQIELGAKKNDLGVKLISNIDTTGKKYVVGDFVTHFKNRFIFIKNILETRKELKNLVSINKISNYRPGISVIGIVADKKVTKNKNILLEVEDLTGRLKILVNQNKQEIYEKAQDIALDSVIGFTGSGSREIFFANNVIFPDAKLPTRKRGPVEEHALFLSDIQVGSKIFMEKNFEKFIEYLNGDSPEVKKIKYLFFVGDVVEGVGIFPKQENELIIRDLEEQYELLAEYLGKIRKDITIIISPGNHDGIRLQEPQPMIDEKYAWPVYNLKNVVLTTNPSTVNIGAQDGFDGFNVLLYHGFSYPFYADNVPKFVQIGKVLNKPTLIMKYLLKHRHLAPNHKSVQSAPLEEDGLLIRDIPDIFVSGHTHKMEIDYYNNILLISAATWEEQNKFQLRMGNKPDFCKVPLLNLKTGQVKILDFENMEENKEQEILA